MQEESYKLRNNIEIIYIKSYYFQLNMVIPDRYIYHQALCIRSRCIQGDQHTVSGQEILRRRGYVYPGSLYFR